MADPTRTTIPNSYLRQGSVALILSAIIVASGDAKCASAAWKADGLVAELALPGIAEHVDIFKPTIQIELRDLAIVELHKSIPIEFKRPRMLLPRIYKNRPTSGGLRIVGKREIVRHIVSGRIPLQVKKWSNSAGRGLPVVSQHNDKLMPLNVYSVSDKTQIGPQLPFARYTRVAYLNDDDAGKKKGGNDQQLIVVDANPVDEGNDVTRSAIMFGGVLAFLAYLILRRKP